jgi:hypothetical protein
MVGLPLMLEIIDGQAVASNPFDVDVDVTGTGPGGIITEARHCKSRKRRTLSPSWFKSLCSAISSRDAIAAQALKNQSLSLEQGSSGIRVHGPKILIGLGVPRL